MESINSRAIVVNEATERGYVMRDGQFEERLLAIDEISSDISVFSLDLDCLEDEDVDKVKQIVEALGRKVDRQLLNVSLGGSLCWLSFESVIAIVKALASLKNIISFSVENVYHSYMTRIVYEVVIENAGLQTLRLSHCKLDDEDLTVLAGVLRPNKSIASLSLDHNQITGVGLTALAKVLIDNTTLSVLDLSDNNISDGGLSELAYNSSIVDLNLERNDVTDSNMCDLKGNMSLLKISIQNGRLTHRPVIWQAMQDIVDSNRARAGKFLKACQAGDLETVHHLLSRLRVSPYCYRGYYYDRDSLSGTGAQIAVKHRQLLIIEYLLYHYPSLLHCGDAGATPLDLAKADDSPAVLKFLQEVVLPKGVSTLPFDPVQTAAERKSFEKELWLADKKILEANLEQSKLEVATLLQRNSVLESELSKSRVEVEEAGRLAMEAEDARDEEGQALLMQKALDEDALLLRGSEEQSLKIEALEAENKQLLQNLASQLEQAQLEQKADDLWEEMRQAQLEQAEAENKALLDQLNFELQTLRDENKLLVRDMERDRDFFIGTVSRLSDAQADKLSKQREVARVAQEKSIQEIESLKQELDVKDSEIQTNKALLQSVYDELDRLPEFSSLRGNLQDKIDALLKERKKLIEEKVILSSKIADLEDVQLEAVRAELQNTQRERDRAKRSFDGAEARYAEVERRFKEIENRLERQREILRKFRPKTEDLLFHDLLSVDFCSTLKNKPSPKCFISYTWEITDSVELKQLQTWLKQLKVDLEDVGAKCFLDVTDMTGRMDQKMKEEIQQSDYFFLICTPYFKKRVEEGLTPQLKECIEQGKIDELKAGLAQVQNKEFEPINNVTLEFVHIIARTHGRQDALIPLRFKGEFQDSVPCALPKYLIRDATNAHNSQDLTPYYHLLASFSDPLGIIPVIYQLREAAQVLFRKNCERSFEDFIRTCCLDSVEKVVEESKKSRRASVSSAAAAAQASGFFGAEPVVKKVPPPVSPRRKSGVNSSNSG